jgi:hypothetical protein
MREREREREKEEEEKEEENLKCDILVSSLLLSKFNLCRYSEGQQERGHGGGRRQGEIRQQQGGAVQVECS